MSYPKKCELCGFDIEDDADLDWHGIGNCVDLCPECGADDVPECRTCTGSGWVPFPSNAG